ncbi:glycosyltransferase [Acetobacter okinawensis]|uniref:glycosyltransferase n=1 Tax=Acetobacter okinawensis TaxID=1076594 RepID=UPI001BA9095E|nr:glycosyltransferase [Acetobacter okinawensis]
MKVWGGTELSSIGVVIHDFKFGGSERIAIRLANYWAGNGFSVTVFCASVQGEMRHLLCDSVRVVCTSPVLSRHYGSMYQLARRARWYFSENPVDFCYIPGNYHWLVTHELARLPVSSRPVLVSQISSLIYKPGRSRFRQMLFNLRMRYLLSRSDLVVAMDRMSARQSNAILHRTDTLVIPLPALDATGAPPTPRPATLSVVAAGRLTEQKGFDDLVRAFALVRRALPQAQLTICGEGEERPALEQLIRSYGLEDAVTLVGYVQNIRPYLDRNAIFVLSSRREGYGAVLLEALEAGRYVVTTDCTPAVYDIFDDGVCGKVVPPNNPKALAEGLVEALQNGRDITHLVGERVARFRINVGAQMYIAAVESKLHARRG